MARKIPMSLVLFGVLALASFAALFWQSRLITVQLGDASILTGYTLFVTILLLGMFNARKKLSMIPLGRARTWLIFHVVLGVFALALFWLHTGGIWPLGLYEQLLAGSFYLVSASGVFGYLLQKALPSRLTHTGIEIIYDRIPAEIAEIRERAETLVIECTKETGSETVAQHYVGTLFWYFQKPRFLFAHLFGGDAAGFWLRGPGSAARRYLNDVEKKLFDEILDLAALKAHVDRHYVCQGVMKKWLFLHIPLAVSVVTLAVWHLILVNVYVL
ncbi:MAG: hypothetical protein JKY20_05295 [Alphaproteobacteria bacterium]|nr:hypothetical protein [Alphaproteobacteria bacterium]